MKSSIYTILIILLTLCLLGSNAFGQRPKATEVALGEPERTALTALSDSEKATLTSTVEVLLRSITKAKESGFSKYRSFVDGPSGSLAKASKSFDECMAFLPDGITKSGLRNAWEALGAAWLLDREARGETVDQNAVVGVIDKYKLDERTTPDAMSRNLLARAESAMVVAAKAVVQVMK